MSDDLDDADMEASYALGEEGPWIAHELLQLVYATTKPATMPALTLQGCARLILALRRLPAVTEGVALTWTVSIRGEDGAGSGEMRYCDVTVDEEAFRISMGGSVYNPSVGSDSYSNTIFEAYAEGGREGDPCDFGDWLEQAKRLIRRGAEVDVTDDALPGGPDAWGEHAASQREPARHRTRRGVVPPPLRGMTSGCHVTKQKRGRPSGRRVSSAAGRTGTALPPVRYSARSSMRHRRFMNKSPRA